MIISRVCGFEEHVTSSMTSCVDLLADWHTNLELFAKSHCMVIQSLMKVQVLDCIEPQEDDIVILKTSSSVFTTTNIDILLRNLDKKQLLIAGCLTDQ